MRFLTKKIALFFCLCSFYFSFSQTLNLPPRNSNALTGSQFVATISANTLTLNARENLIFTEISNGNVPDFYRSLIPVTSTATIGGGAQIVTYYVIPDYLAIGNDTNYFICPMSPMLATRIGDLTACTLPTRKMVNDIWATATVKLAPAPISPGPGMTTVPVFDQHNLTVKNLRQAVVLQHPLGELVSGDKKDVVISNQIYTNSNRVIIYGWHQTNGTPIQPLSGVHADTYMDYSHGIRLVQNSCMLNGTTPTTVQSILQSSVLNSILSDEGQILQPYYPYSLAITELSTPISFAVLQHTPTSIEIKVKNDVAVSDYLVYTSSDGVTFNSPITLPKTNLIVNNLSTNLICFIKIASYNATYVVTSPLSEVLAAVPSSTNDSVLIVNGFDRLSLDNTYDFVIQHGTSFYNNQRYFESASNEAVIDGLVVLNNYNTVDYILGKESSANETFSNTEQTIVADYLKQGGHFFVSGSEIAWDLDHLGSLTDKSFFNNYLKSTYTADAPNNAASTFYTVFNDALNFSIFNTIDSIAFDDGTNGTYNVDYPDVINPNAGGVPDLHYVTNITEISGIHYEGQFNGGSVPGKLVYLCFPFETIYNNVKRDIVMSKIIDFFDGVEITTEVQENHSFGNIEINIFPNPINSIGTVLFNVSKEETILIDLLDILGNRVQRIVSQRFAPGEYRFTINTKELSAGIYFLSIKTKNTKKIIKTIISH
jgi:hypothetical protein